MPAVDSDSKQSKIDIKPMRPLNFKKDFEKLVSFLNMVFEDELSAKGGDITEFMNEYKSMMPLLRIAGVFSSRFRNMLDGFIFENSNGEIIGTVTTGNAGNYWEIGMVAIRPDYRRQGLARKLVNRAIDHTKEHGVEICILEVISVNTPAYELYKSLGFIHYDSMIKLMLEPANFPADIDNAVFPESYLLKETKYDKKTYRERYELEVRATPDKVQEFLPVDENSLKRSRLKNVLRPIVKKIAKMKIRSWTLYSNNEIAGSFYVHVARSEKSTNNIGLIIDPDHVEKLSEFIMRFILDLIQKNGSEKQNCLITVRESNEHLLAVLKQHGFVEYERNHLLGIKINN